MRKFFRESSLYLVLFLILISAVLLFGKDPQPVKEMNVSEIIHHLENGRVKSITSKSNIIQGALKDKTKFRVVLPEEMKNDFYSDYLKEKVDAGKLVYGAEEEAARPWLFDILPTIIVLVVFGVFWFVLMNKSQGGGNKMMSFGKSKAKLHKDEGEKVTFKDVAGLQEEKEELKEIVDFLQGPKKYLKMGARIPKGVLLVGPPGTGKTYLSRAVAGEAGVPFFSISGSDFVEMFVGVGASRVRDLFEQAKKSAPCIVFIDEIDAVGRKRGSGVGGGHDEREQTLNQLLVEMDGFGTNEGIIVMAATNRPDILDPAILRPGRFDRQVYVGLPDVRAREAILKVHTRKKPLEEDVDLAVIARRTPGFSPADLENLTNEAALLAARHNKDKIDMKTINEASIKVVAGPEKKSAVVSEKERRLTAYHEAGHAIASRALPESDKVHMVTIIPRGRAGGFTAYIPEGDQSYMTKSQMKDEIVGLLGGRVAEAVVLKDISTGAQNDLERATKMARNMVTHYGMSDKLGPMTYGNDEDPVFVGRDFGRTKDYSEMVAAEIDTEIRSIIDEAYNKTENILRENLDKLERVAEALLVRETINGQEFEDLYNGMTLEEIEKKNKESINAEDEIDKNDTQESDETENTQIINDEIIDEEK